MTDLDGKQRQHLRGLAHDLDPVVHVGRAGLTDAVVAQADTALADHELIKVKVPLDREERRAVCESLAERTGAALVSTIGHVAILYRPRPDPEERDIRLPG